MSKKLMGCKACGAKIAKSADRCPKCGARTHQGARVFATLVAVAAIIFMIIAIANASRACANARNQTTIAPISVEVSAPDLWQAYTENQVNADNLYGGKTIAVTGKISNIGKDIVTGKPYVSLVSGDQLGIYPIQCFFPNEDQNEKIAALKDGQEITIVGKCNGISVVHVQLSNCYIPD